MAREAISFNGRPYTPEDTPPVPLSWPPARKPNYNVDLIDAYRDFTSEPLDISDLIDVNKALMRARNALSASHQVLRDTQRGLEQAEARYRHAYAGAILNASGGTEAIRSALADWECEKERNERDVAAQLVEEAKSHSYQVKKDIDVLVALSNNIRATMKTLTQ